MKNITRLEPVITALWLVLGIALTAGVLVVSLVMTTARRMVRTGIAWASTPNTTSSERLTDVD